MKASMHSLTLVLLTSLALWQTGCGRRNDDAAGGKPGAASDVAKAVSPSSISGYWVGDLEVGKTSLMLGFDLIPTEGGKLRVSFDSLNQGVHDLAGTGGLEGNLLTVDLDLKQGGLAKYTGELSADGKTFTGSWRQGPGTLPLELRRGDRAQAIADTDPSKKLTPADLPSNKAAGEQLVGEWKGTLSAGGKSLRTVFSIMRQPEGICTAQMTSVDQGNTKLPVDKVLLKDKELTLELPGIQGRFVGTVNADKQKIEGQWSQAGLSFPLTLDRASKANP